MLEHDEPLSKFAFKSNVRRYSKALVQRAVDDAPVAENLGEWRAVLRTVGLCRVRLKAPGIKRLKINCEKLLKRIAFTFNLRRYRTVRHEAMDHGEDATREDREDAARKMWRYAADPMGKEAFEDERTLEVVGPDQIFLWNFL